MNVATLLRRAAADHPGRVALRLDDEEIGYPRPAETGRSKDLLRPTQPVAERLATVGPGGGFDDMIVSGGENIFPQMVEEDLADCPNLRGMHRPRRIEIVEALPRTGSGELDRPALRRMFP